MLEKSSRACNLGMSKLISMASAQQVLRGRHLHAKLTRQDALQTHTGEVFEAHGLAERRLGLLSSQIHQPEERFPPEIAPFGQLFGGNLALAKRLLGQGVFT